MIICIKVKPNSKENKLVKINEREYYAEIEEKAEDNRANIELIRLLSRELGVSQNKIKIKNPKSREKLVEIDVEK
jgi:uncharacterized protein YggU (UPF0235/DUF167 family)